LDSFKKKHRPKDYLGWITKEGHEAKGEEDEEEGDAGEDESTNQ
jgi:hypothetical protein